MAEFAIGQSFLKAHRSILRVVPLKNACRYFPVRDSAGFITLPTLDTGDWYRELQSVKQVGFKVDNNEKEFRLVGDEGWSDSVTVGSKVSASFDTFFSKLVVQTAGNVCAEPRADYSDEFAIIERTRYDTDFEVYVEMLKEMGRANGTSGNFIYDFAAFNSVFRNYDEKAAAEDLINVTFNGMSRGSAIFGRLDVGAAPLTFGGIQSVILATAPSSGTRRYAVVPVDNGSAIVTTANLTVTYTSDGTTALTQLGLGQLDGSGFRLENASTGVRIPCAVSLNTGTGVVTIDPVPTLAAATIFRLVVRDGAINQAVDAAQVASPTGIRRPLAGFTTTFRTA